MNNEWDEFNTETSHIHGWIWTRKRAMLHCCFLEYFSPWSWDSFRIMLLGRSISTQGWLRVLTHDLWSWKKAAREEVGAQRLKVWHLEAHLSVALWLWACHIVFFFFFLMPTTPGIPRWSVIQLLNRPDPEGMPHLFVLHFFRSLIPSDSALVLIEEFPVTLTRREITWSS